MDGAVGEFWDPVILTIWSIGVDFGPKLKDLANANFVIPNGATFVLKTNPKVAATRAVEALRDPKKSKLTVFDLQKTTLLVRRRIFVISSFRLASDPVIVNYCRWTSLAD